MSSLRLLCCGPCYKRIVAGIQETLRDHVEAGNTSGSDDMIPSSNDNSRIVFDSSRVTLKIAVSLTDNSRGIICAHL